MLRRCSLLARALRTSGTARNVHLTPSLAYHLFWEKDKKSGYDTAIKNVSKKEMLREGLKEIRSEIALWTKEMKERFEMDPVIFFRPGETDVMWKFSSENDLDKWVCTSDSDHSEGHSRCSFELNHQGKAVFSGVLDTRVPKDGRVERAGYCNIRTKRARKSFKRDAFHDWTNYNMLVMRVRGDGRSYALNLSCMGTFDILWNDVYHYILFTRGGPYWQMVRIPFSKFFLSSKGRTQDAQGSVPLHRITNFGITAADKINGPFKLEIDYIGVEFDPSHTEEFAYEMYSTGNAIVRN